MGHYFLANISSCSLGMGAGSLRPGVRGVVFWYVQSVNSGTESWVLVVLPSVPGETTVILMLGGTQAASSVILRNGLGACDGVGTCDGVGAFDSVGAFDAAGAFNGV
jgi:hypothetical protein